MRHLQDPENVDIRDEGARERRIGILEDIMNSTYKDVRRKVRAEPVPNWRTVPAKADMNAGSKMPHVGSKLPRVVSGVE